MSLSARGGAAVAPSETASAPSQHDSSPSLALRVGLAAFWPLAMVAVVYTSVGRLGFYPTDEGLIQAWSYRILQGQVPHRDFVAPLPMGSAVIHLVDFAIPAPLFEVSRVIAMGEYCAYGIFFAWLIFAWPPSRWGLVAVAGAIGSILVNLNTFPLMAWYTVDGLLFVAAGLVAVDAGVRRKSNWRLTLGFLLLGTGIVTKQSFFMAPAIGWLLLLPQMRETSWAARLRTLFVTGVVSSIPLLAFLGSIAAVGGVHDLRSQLLGAAFVYGRPLLAEWSPRHDFIALALLAGGTTIVAALVETGRLRAQGWSRLAVRAAFSVAVIGVPVASWLGLYGNQWGMRLFWMAAAYVFVSAVIRRSLDQAGLAVVACAWMSSLSYGYAWPNLVAGTAGLYLLDRVWSGAYFALPGPLIPRVTSVASALIALTVIAFVFGEARLRDVYLDRPAGQLTANLGAVAPAFGSIRTNSLTAEYLAQMVECVKRFPASRVAVLPENAAIYPALHLENPFPIDWMWQDSMRGSETRILATADELNREGDYLVMFQTLDEPQIVNGSSLPAATPGSTIAAFSPVPAEIYARLNGTKTTCHTFLVVYSPSGGR